MIELSRAQTIPPWARLSGRRPAGSSEYAWALQAAPGGRHPWAVPVTLTDDPPVPEGLLRAAIETALGGVS
jgi:hypothetical protein